jgi:hypothetical protein
MPGTRTVPADDTLSGMAHARLGDAGRRPGKLLVNRPTSNTPSRVSPARSITCPATPHDPAPTGRPSSRATPAPAWPKPSWATPAASRPSSTLNRDVTTDPSRSCPIPLPPRLTVATRGAVLHPRSLAPQLLAAVGCQKSIGCHAARSYSWMRPPRTSWRWSCRVAADGSACSQHSDGSGADKLRPRWGRWRL